MTRDVSLDEFLDQSEDDGEERGADGEPEADAGATADGDAGTQSAADVEAEPSEGSDGAPAEQPAEEPEPEADATDGPPTPADVEPARSTYTWSPGGAECAACGATVTERWRDDGQPVCADCKDWAGTPD